MADLSADALLMSCRPYRAPATLLFALLLGACVPRTGEAPVATPSIPQPRPYSLSGLENVIGSPVSALVSRLGRPDLDLREGPARKLQFLGPACVLDVYLYPQRSGAEPVATHVDARQPDGGEMDRSSCVAALLARQRSR